MAENEGDKKSKDNNVNLSTFLSWKKEGFIGYKTEEIEGKKVVNFVWCKVCARYKETILSRLKGSVKTSACSLIDGTNFVTKHSVTRHLDGKAGSCHQIALELERGKPKDQQVDIGACVSGTVQQDIVSMTKSSTKDGYMKLFPTAYELAMNPTLPLSQFKTLVKVQRNNGSRLIEGHDTRKAAREFIHYIADAVTEKVAGIVASSDFMSILSDGSQARKKWC